MDSVTSSSGRLARRGPSARRGERGGHAGAGQRHRVPRPQAQRVEHLGVQPDDAAPGVGGGGGEPGDERDRRESRPNASAPRRAATPAGTADRDRSHAASAADASRGRSSRGRLRRGGRAGRLRALPGRGRRRRGGRRGAGRVVAEAPHRAGHGAAPARDPPPQRRPQPQPPRRARRARHRPPLPRRHVPGLGVPGQPAVAVHRVRDGAAGRRRRPRPSPRNGTVISTAAASPTSTSSGATSRGGTRTVFSDSVGSRLTISAATTTVHTATSSGADHQPRPEVQRQRTAAGRATSAAAGAGTPTKNSLAYGGCVLGVEQRVEPGQPQRHAHREDQRDDPAEPVALQRPDVEHQRGRDPERDAGRTASRARRRSCWWRRAAGPAGRRGRRTAPRPPIAATHSSNRPLSAKCTADSPAHSASDGDGVRQQPHPGGRRRLPGISRLPGSSASTVSPPIVRWPGVDQDPRAGRQVEVDPGAEPDQAVGLARRHLVAGRDVAHDPPGQQPGDLHDADAGGRRRSRSSRALRSLSSLALSRSADRNLPGRYSTARTRPSTGIALHVHVEHRQEHADPRRRPAGRPSSAGGAASATWPPCRRPRRSTTPVARRRHPVRVRGRTRRWRRWRARPATAPRPVTSADAGPRPRRPPATIGPPAGVHRRDGGPDQPGDVRERESGRAVGRSPWRRSGIGADRLLRRGGPDGPRWRRLRYARRRRPTGRRDLRRRGRARERKGPGPPSPETTTPAVEPLVRSPATGGRSFACGRLPGPRDKYPRASDRSSRSRREEPRDVPDRPNAHQ